MIDSKNILLFAGGGQNVGKTTLVCRLIEQFSSNHDIVALKMSSHLHPLADDCDFVAKGDDYAIVRERDMDLPKDSGKMLRAGAKEVFYVQAKPDVLPTIVPVILGLIDGRLCICESGGLRQLVKPSAFVYLTASDKAEKDGSKHLADIIINNFDFSRLVVEVDNNEWRVTVI